MTIHATIRPDDSEIVADRITVALADIIDYCFKITNTATTAIAIRTTNEMTSTPLHPPPSTVIP